MLVVFLLSARAFTARVSTFVSLEFHVAAAMAAFECGVRVLTLLGNGFGRHCTSDAAED